MWVKIWLSEAETRELDRFTAQFCLEHPGHEYQREDLAGMLLAKKLGEEARRREMEQSPT